MWSSVTALAASIPVPAVELKLADAAEPAAAAGAVKIVVLLTVLSLAPAILISVTAFTRILVVLSFLRQALGANSMPPAHVIAALSLFLTFFVMSPVVQRADAEGLRPYLAGEIDRDVAFDRAAAPFKEFMLANVRDTDLGLMLELDHATTPATRAEVSLRVLIPAFMLSELRTAFEMGMLVLIPFLVIDLVCASVLMSMGMMMLPPVFVSLPLKILVFVLADGWTLVLRSLVRSFATIGGSG